MPQGAPLHILAAQILQGITLVKILVAVCMVVGLSVIAERISPRWAGIISGYPLGSAISLFFIGYEVGPEFAGRSALYNIVGLTATQVFAYAYYRTARCVQAAPKALTIVAASVGGLIGYFAAVAVLRPIPVTPLSAVLITGGFILFFDRLFRSVENVRIVDRGAVGPAVLLVRALFAAVLVILITSTAGIVGPQWAGLFSAFPVTLFPFMLIIHITYRNEHVYTVVKYLPRGLGSLLVYSLVVSAAYPALGVGWGTLIAYAAATAYLVLIHVRPRPAWIKVLRK